MRHEAAGQVCRAGCLRRRSRRPRCCRQPIRRGLRGRQGALAAAGRGRWLARSGGTRPLLRRLCCLLLQRRQLIKQLVHRGLGCRLPRLLLWARLLLLHLLRLLLPGVLLLLHLLRLLLPGMLLLLLLLLLGLWLGLLRLLRQRRLRRRRRRRRAGAWRWPPQLLPQLLRLLQGK